MLCEVLCKIIITNVVHKILKVVYETKVLDKSNHGYLAGRGTGTALNDSHQLSGGRGGEANDL